MTSDQPRCSEPPLSEYGTKRSAIASSASMSVHA